MATTYQNCNECNGLTEHRVMGMIPAAMLAGDMSIEWVNTAVCSNCGSVNIINPTDKDLCNAEERYIDILADMGFVPEDEKDEILRE